MRRMRQYEVPVDGRPHTFTLTSSPVAIGAPGEFDVVEFWAEYDDEAGGSDYVYQVFGTGQPIPDSAYWVGTSQRTARYGLVWHLYEMTS